MTRVSAHLESRIFHLFHYVFTAVMSFIKDCPSAKQLISIVVIDSGLFFLPSLLSSVFYESPTPISVEFSGRDMHTFNKN